MTSVSLQEAAERVAGALMLDSSPVPTPSVAVMQQAARELLGGETPAVSGTRALVYYIPSRTDEGTFYMVALHVVLPLPPDLTQRVVNRYQVTAARCSCPARETCHHIVQTLIIAERDGVSLAT
jgi:hypothetical protein